MNSSNLCGDLFTELICYQLTLIGVRRTSSCNVDKLELQTVVPCIDEIMCNAEFLIKTFFNSGVKSLILAEKY